MKTIRQQLTCNLLVVFGLLIGAGELGVYFATRHTLLKGFDDALRAKAVALGALLQHREPSPDLRLPDELMERTHRRAAADFFEAWDSRNIAFLRSASLGDADLPKGDKSFHSPQFWIAKSPAGQLVRAMGLDLKVEGDHDQGEDSANSNIIHLVVASDLRDLDHTFSILAFVLLVCGLVLLMATVSVVPYVLRRSLASLDQMSEQAARITADSLETRFAVENLPGELAPISGRLNDLLERLQRAFERERKFGADLAHELRTPIAELRALAEVALKWPGARPAGTDSEMLAIALQMEGMVSRLLGLLRSEHGMLAVTFTDVALLPLVKDVWRAFADQAASKEIQLDLNISGETKVNADPVLLRSILSGLLDNAVEYTPRGERIAIECEATPRQFRLRISNTVEDLTAADVARIFDRFWRKDAARSNDGHCGLGLSLARGFARAMGFEILAALEGEARLTLSIIRDKAVVGGRQAAEETFF